jgi:hypothetical protein
MICIFRLAAGAQMKNLIRAAIVWPTQYSHARGERAPRRGHPYTPQRA